MLAEEFELNAPEGYEDADVNVAEYIKEAYNFESATQEIENDDSKEGYTFTVGSEGSATGFNFKDVSIHKGEEDSNLVGKVRLRSNESK